MFKMNEGRKSQIVLLDERRLDMVIQPKLYSSELLDLVASHFKLKEKQYFGLGFFDNTSHFNWLQGEKRVLDHEFPKKTGLLVLHFAIKFYVDTIGLLRDSQTVELFYLNARQLVFRGQLECDTETVFELAAHVLQAAVGDFVSVEETRQELKKLPVIPTCTLKEHPSLAFCEDRVTHFYEKISGSSKGLAIVNYMTIVEKLPTYGSHYYEVKDKKDIPWWLGISTRGIAVYDKNDKSTPRKLFTWKNLENLYYRERKFSIEVHGSKRVSVSRRTFGASQVDVHAWFASTPQLTKCIWSMAVVQHQFYLDRKQSKSQLATARSMSEIAADLSASTSSLPGSVGSDLSRSPSSQSLPSLSNSRYDLTIEQTDSLKAERDLFQALKARKEALEAALEKKLEELKMICFQEGELTGETPHDFPLSPGEQLPLFRRRVGTCFTLSIKTESDTDQLSNQLAKLELEVDLQSKITAAAHRLASDKTVSKYVRKQRRQSYTKAFGKLKDMETKLDEMRKMVTKYPSIAEKGSRLEDHLEVSANIKTPANHQMSSDPNEQSGHKSALSPSHSSPQLSIGPASCNGRIIPEHQNRVHVLASASSAHHPAPLGKTTAGPLGNMSGLDGSHDSGFSSANNMYCVSSQRTSHYESSDQLQSPVALEPAGSFLQSGLYCAVSRRTAGDEPFQRRTGPTGSACLHYGSLDRKRRDYRQEQYRDVSPVRYKPVLSDQSREARYRHSPSGVVVEVPVHHQPPAAQPLYYGSGHERFPNSFTSTCVSSFNREQCYSPRQLEGCSNTSLIETDTAQHPHTRSSQDHHALSSPVYQIPVAPAAHPLSRSSQDHHVLSSPVYQIPVAPAAHPLSSHHQLPHQPSMYVSGLERTLGLQQHQPLYPPEQTLTCSPQSSSAYYSSSPRTIPIQRVDSPSVSSPVSGSPCPSSPRGLTSHATSTLVTVTRLQPHTEVSKPYEMSDFYRYSEKLRRQRIIDQYQRQLIGEDWMSRSSSPQSFESDQHPAHSSFSSPVKSPQHQKQVPTNSLSCNSHKAAARGPSQPYSRSISAPVSMLPPAYYSQHNASNFGGPEGQVSSLTSTYTMRTHTPHMQYAMQSSTYQMQQVHSSTKHSMYQPPQPMTCKPVRHSPPGPSDSQSR